MRKFLVAVLLLLSFSIGFSQDKQDDQFEKTLYDAIESGSFTFTALSMKPALGKMVPVNVPEKTIDVRPNHFMAEIVYDDVPNSAYETPEYIVVDMPAYTYSAEYSDKFYIVTIVVENLAKTPYNPNSKFTFTFKVKRKTGGTTLEVKPDITHPVTYMGSVMPE